MVRRSLPSSLINTTAPPTGQNSLTCTRFSLRGSETPPKAKPPPYPPPRSSVPALGQAEEKKERQTESLGTHCAANWDLTAQHWPLTQAKNNPSPLLATTLHLLRLPQSTKSTFRAPITIRASFSSCCSRSRRSPPKKSHCVCTCTATTIDFL
jgi:hypothetical protein